MKWGRRDKRVGHRYFTLILPLTQSIITVFKNEKAYTKRLKSYHKAFQHSIDYHRLIIVVDALRVIIVALAPICGVPELLFLIEVEHLAQI